MNEEAKTRLTRRHVSHLAARLAKMPLDNVVDPRNGEVKTDRDGNVLSTEDRYYVSSLAATRLTPTGWLDLIRRRWSVENQNHMVWDTVLSEDKRPWILFPSGMVVVMLLRRLVYNLLTLYRSVTLRSERNRSQSWTRLLRDINRALLRATVEVMAGVRRRKSVGI